MSGSERVRAAGASEVRVAAETSAHDLAAALVSDTRDSVRLVVLYGSRLLNTSPDPHSAFDFVVVVREYAPFYQAASRSGMLHRPPALMTALARVLAPNVIAYQPGSDDGPIAKCVVVSEAHFERAMGADPPDHFLLARMIQDVSLVWAADSGTRAWFEQVVSSAHAGVLAWVAPHLSGPLDARLLGRRMLEVCYRGELRPESRDRSSRVFEAQAAHFDRVFEPVIARAERDGRLVREGDRYVLRGPVDAGEVRRWRRHFRRSKIRATLRWFKYMVTFANWLPYLQRKVERRTGRTIHLTLLERKLPIVFLWPRAVHVLLTRPRKEVAASTESPET